MWPGPGEWTLPIHSFPSLGNIFSGKDCSPIMRSLIKCCKRVTSVPVKAPWNYFVNCYAELRFCWSQRFDGLSRQTAPFKRMHLRRWADSSSARLTEDYCCGFSFMRQVCFNALSITCLQRNTTPHLHLHRTNFRLFKCNSPWLTNKNLLVFVKLFKRQCR